MSSQFAWFYDIFTIAVMCICIYTCGKRGFLRSILLLVGYIVALLFAYFFSAGVAPSIYESMVQPHVIEYVETKTENIEPVKEIQNALNTKYGVYGINFSEAKVRSFLSEDKNETINMISDFVSDKAMFDILGDKGDELIGGILNEEFAEKFNSYIPSDFSSEEIDFNDDEVWKDAVAAIKGETSSLAMFVEKYFLRDAITGIVRLAVFILTFVVLAVIIKVVSKLLKIVDHIPLVNSANSLLGGLLGAVQGILSMYVIALIIRLLILIGGDGMIFFNSSTIEQTYLFRFFYNMNIF